MEHTARTASVVEANYPSLDRSSAEITYELSKEDSTKISNAPNDLETAIAAKSGKLVIWQCADNPSELLPTASTRADIKATSADQFAAEMDTWLEKVLTDYTKDFTLTFNTTGKLVDSITGITSIVFDNAEIYFDGTQKLREQGYAYVDQHHAPVVQGKAY